MLILSITNKYGHFVTLNEDQGHLMIDYKLNNSSVISEELLSYNARFRSESVFGKGFLAFELINTNGDQSSIMIEIFYGIGK